MLGSIKRWFSGGAAHAPLELSSLEQWAASRSLILRRVHEEQGFVLEGQLGTQAWRGEWGESQRSYIPGAEFRLIAEMGLPKDLLALVLNRALMESMEKTVFEQFVEGVQTRIDTETPPEMRWLVMFPKLGAHELKALRHRYAALSSVGEWLQQWLDGPLGKSLEDAQREVAADVPVVLAIGRGRLTLRTAMPQPDPQRMALWQGVFEHAVREGHRAVHDWRGAAGGAHSTQPSAWSHSALPREEPPGR